MNNLSVNSTTHNTHFKVFVGERRITLVDRWGERVSTSRNQSTNTKPQIIEFMTQNGCQGDWQFVWLTDSGKGPDAVVVKLD